LEQSKRDAKSLGKKARLLFRQNDYRERKMKKDLGGPLKNTKPDQDRKSDRGRKKEDAKPRIPEKPIGKVIWTDKSESTEGNPITVIDERGEGRLWLHANTITIVGLSA